MFIDEVKIYVEAGAGGRGSASMRREKFVPHGGPAGGNGGRGGDVILKATRHASTLAFYYRRRHFRADGGAHGGTNDRYGKYGKPLVLEAPLGTLVRDAGEGAVMADLQCDGDTFVIARGGRGGRGSTALTREHHLARYAENGEPGESRWIVLELKLLADVGLVGFPNVGKSTLISRVSAARPKIADYPFTTLQPHLGVVAFDRATSFVMADIPGLVEGAHEGKGMGDRFLRHIERTRLLLHMIDVSGWEGRNPVEDWRSINRELSAWHPQLAEKPQVLVANKMDVDTSKANLQRLKRAARRPVFPISAVTGEGVEALLGELAKLLPTLPYSDLLANEASVPTGVLRQPPRPLSVEKVAPGLFAASGTQLERLVARTPIQNPYAMADLQSKFYRMGLSELLVQAGANAGDTVTIGGFEFTYVPDE
ncbi:MAG: GTPase ObgE [Candidatus Riflebacteria bacterium]|nr:GTPase ObgE [Candidatus Riflebacteria bacterium]